MNTAPNRCVEQNAFVFVDSKGADNQESDARHYTADDMQLLLTRGEFDAKASHLCISNEAKLQSSLAPAVERGDGSSEGTIEELVLI